MDVIDGYDLERLTPGGAVIEHVDYGMRLETEPGWLFVREPSGQARLLLPEHAVVEVRGCGGGASCRARVNRSTSA